MTTDITRRGRCAWAFGLVCLLAPAATAQILWGTASATPAFPNGRLIRIDYATGTVQATFNGPATVVIGDGFTGVAVRPSNGQVFVTDGSGTNNVFRFDPVTGANLGSLGSPTSATSIDGLEFHAGELYASSYANARIFRINPDTGALLGQLPNTLPGIVEGGLTIANGDIYTRGGTGNTLIARRSLTTGAVLGEFATPNNELVTGLATDGTNLFAASNAGVLYRLDFNGAVLDSRAIGITLDGLGGITPVPEPSGGLALVVSALAVGAWRRRRMARLPSGTDR